VLTGRLALSSVAWGLTSACVFFVAMGRDCPPKLRVQIPTLALSSFVTFEWLFLFF
jgi:hypothetical protein